QAVGRSEGASPQADRLRRPGRRLPLGRIRRDAAARMGLRSARQDLCGRADRVGEGSGMTRIPDDAIWIDLTDHEIRMAYWFYVPNFFLKKLHSLPLTDADGSPTEWADLPKRWGTGTDREIYVRQAWR